MHVQRCDSPGLQEELEIRGSACINLKIQSSMIKQDCSYVFHQTTALIAVKRCGEYWCCEKKVQIVVP